MSHKQASVTTVDIDDDGIIDGIAVDNNHDGRRDPVTQTVLTVDVKSGKVMLSQ